MYMQNRKCRNIWYNNIYNCLYSTSSMKLFFFLRTVLLFQSLCVASVCPVKDIVIRVAVGLTVTVQRTLLCQHRKNIWQAESNLTSTGGAVQYIKTAQQHITNGGALWSDHEAHDSMMKKHFISFSTPSRPLTGQHTTLNSLNDLSSGRTWFFIMWMQMRKLK